MLSDETEVRLNYAFRSFPDDIVSGSILIRGLLDPDSPDIRQTVFREFDALTSPLSQSEFVGLLTVPLSFILPPGVTGFLTFDIQISNSPH